MYITYMPEEKPMPPFQREPEKEFKSSLAKLAAFVLISVINDNFLYYIFLYPCIMILSFLPEGTGDAVYYAAQWIINDISVYLIPGISAYLLFRNELKAPNAFKEHSAYIPWLSGGLIFFALCFLGSISTMLSNFIAEILDTLFGTGEIPDAIAGALPQNGSLSTFIVLIVSVAVIAPVCEELIFRRLLLYPLRKHGDGFAIVATSLIFGFTHGNFDQLPYAFTVGLLLGLLAVNSNSVIPSMVLHTLNNLLVTVGSYSVSILGENEITLGLENGINIGLNLAFWLGIPALVVMAASGMFKSDYDFQLSKGEKARIIFASPASYLIAAGLGLMMVDVYGAVMGLLGLSDNI